MSKRLLELLLTCIVVVNVGCARESESAQNVEARSVAEPRVTIDKAPVPARYESELPNTVAGMRAWREGDRNRAPLSHVIDNLAFGDAKWMGRLVDAGKNVSAADSTEWAQVWDGLLEFQDMTPAFCTQAREIMAGPPAAARLALSGPFAKSCATSADRALVLRDDTPSWAVLDYFDPWRDYTQKQAQPYDARLAQAAREVIMTADVQDARQAAFLLAMQGNKDAEAALLAIHADIKDRTRADEIAFAFLETQNEAGRKLAKAACARKPNDPMCNRDPGQQLAQEAEDEKPNVAAVTARIEQLRSVGFDKVAQLTPSRVEDDAAEGILVQAGYAHWFDVETGQYPNEHDSLLRTLARLAAPELNGAIFEEIASMDEEEIDSKPYELIAYADGKRYRTTAENLGDWYDLDAVLQLLNTMMTDRQAAVRYAVLDTGDQTAIVVAALPTAVRKAADAGLVRLGDAGEAERVGKEYEEEVIKRIEDGTLKQSD